MVTAAPLRIVFFGTPEFAVPTLRQLIGSRHAVVAVVSQPDRPRGRGHQLEATPTKDVATKAGVPVLQPERLRDDAFLAALRDLAPDLGVVAAYGKLLPDVLLQVPRLGLINVHGSVLPRWRGAAPVHRAVIAGDEETGVTIMRVIKELDAGAMFAIRRRAIGPDETSVDVERDLATIGGELLVEIVGKIADGTAVETPQESSKATYAPKLTKAEGSIEWMLPAAQIHNLVRGLQPWPLVSARLGDLRVLVLRTAVTDRTSDAPAATVVGAERDHLEVVAGDRRVIRILDIQPEGRRIMSARDFLAGRRVDVGTPIRAA
jgi:methionyl-tRNA formyltransferase